MRQATAATVPRAGANLIEPARPGVARAEQIMRALADAIISSKGWRGAFVSVLAGAIGALALAPVGFGPALVVPMVVAVWLLDGTCEPLTSCRPTRRALARAFVAGWWLGFGYFVAGFWWLGRLPHRSRVHLGVAAWRARSAGRAGPVLRRRLRRGALALGARPGARAGAGGRPFAGGMGARAPVHRLSRGTRSAWRSAALSSPRSSRPSWASTG